MRFVVHGLLDDLRAQSLNLPLGLGARLSLRLRPLDLGQHLLPRGLVTPGNASLVLLHDLCYRPSSEQLRGEGLLQVPLAEFLRLHRHLGKLGSELIDVRALLLHDALLVRRALGQLLRARSLKAFNLLFGTFCSSPPGLCHLLRMLEELVPLVKLLQRMLLYDFVQLAAELFPLLLQTDPLLFSSLLQSFRDALVVLNPLLKLLGLFFELVLLVGEPPLSDAGKTFPGLFPELLVAGAVGALLEKLVHALVRLRELRVDLVSLLLQLHEAGFDSLLYLCMLCGSLVRLHFHRLGLLLPLRL
mmetsp:Transcript_40504/g.116434  ORF Transcript_40504/g.116434 Transcript_40504/m.116434 type:complete len:302 (-) Transcript_40504:638-1543(-)